MMKKIFKNFNDHVCYFYSNYFSAYYYTFHN